MNAVKVITLVKNESSKSRGLQFIGIPVIGTDGKFLEGKVVLQDGTEAFFHNGLLDGNVYDKNENITEKRPALIYENGGFEYWEKGCPNGFPAIYQDLGLYEEDWGDGKLKEIRIESNIEISA